MTTNRETQLMLDAVAAGIKVPKELANFMAQVTFESSDLKRLEEGFRYTKNIAQITVLSALRKGPEALETARQEALQGSPEKLAELMYSGRMGNNDPGDGFKYRGRGYIQLTGKDNYREAGQALNLDLVEKPQLAAEPENASKIAVWYWNRYVHRVAPEDVTNATHVINNGETGLAERKARFAEWQNKLTPELMASLTGGEVLISASTVAHSQATVQLGARGEAVHELQCRLSSLGYTDAHGNALKPDGHFGANTRHAVKAFQHDHGLRADGVVGPQTFAELDASLQDKRQAHVAPSPAVAQLDSATHSDHGLFKQALSGVHKLDASVGRAPDSRSDNLAAALVVTAREHGMSRIDHVVLSTDTSKVFVVQGALDSALKRVASVPTVEALNTSVAQSTQALDRTTEHQQLAAITQSQVAQQPAREHCASRAL